MSYRNRIIYLPRGDSYSAPIIINLGTELFPEYYTLKGQDALYFGLMEPNQAFEDAILKKKYTASSLRDENGNTLLRLKPSDTSGLYAGKYYYTVKLKIVEDGETTLVKTVIPPSQFFIEGTNPTVVGNERFEVDEYNPDVLPPADSDHIIFDGGEIV